MATPSDKKRAEEILERLLSVNTARMFYDQGLRSADLDRFTDEELVEFIRKPELTKFWQSDGMMVTGWEAMLGLAEQIISLEFDTKYPPETKAIGAIVIAFMALEECVNGFLRECYRAQKISHAMISNTLRKASISDKLNGRLARITKHSLKTDKPELWNELMAAKSIRDENVHNKLIVIPYAEEIKMKKLRIDYEKIARNLLDAIPKIERYLVSIYPLEVHEMSDELKRIWSVVKRRLGFDSAKILAALQERRRT
jgi:hypothetical protein